MPTYLMVAQILVAIALIAVILVQVHGGGLGGIFGQADTVYRTRRGVEKSLMRFTIALVVVLIILSFWAAKIKS
ncbi:MAG: preprotein translocase subunit SecG [Dehalococcoidia bacterium]|nr:MAG: preprotein translocase subunit SecG [Dehalococcoidia bacterium]